MNQSVKLGLRLLAIEQMVTRHYDNIWDCCCDHGLLGMRLLEKQAAEKVHFVDVVESLVNGVNQALSGNPELYPADQWQTLCMDVARLPVSEASTHKGDSHLVIIAGVGGDLLFELVEAIHKANPETNIEFLLCPVRQHFHVRESLINMGMKLINESIVYENRLFYEIIHVARKGREELTCVGSKMWDFSDEDHCLYLQQTVSHYQRRLKSGCEKTAAILQQYQNLR
ncbi:tRNA (adenine(22)-N(1))-methyltransferase TrmK [Endozoicomonas sp. OPT23]|uniref:tRNA (adenine(22)-N(1))-methyltransferase n=1 Tax=Endozoicomonas sp. OPT23 TaxID=2072845 RepID=UPI00189181DC|nr:tRNA (adenine(22)-N(1))-methyltransferase TrmK [Endozoicomonas sp. OPT23]